MTLIALIQKRILPWFLRPVQISVIRVIRGEMLLLLKLAAALHF
jgi:hypothetical protein